MDDENDDMIPQKQSLFPLSADDIVDNAHRTLMNNKRRTSPGRPQMKLSG